MIIYIRITPQSCFCGSTQSTGIFAWSESCTLVMGAYKLSLPIYVQRPLSASYEYYINMNCSSCHCDSYTYIQWQYKTQQCPCKTVYALPYVQTHQDFLFQTMGAGLWLKYLHQLSFLEDYLIATANFLHLVLHFLASSYILKD